MDKPGELILFADVVDAGSLSAAARMRRQTRSVISKRLSGLEEELGARLLNRTTRSLSLTEVGRAVYGRAVRLREQLEETRALVDSFSGKVSGLLRITSARHFGLMVVQPILAEFIRTYPEIDVALNLEDTSEDMVARGYDLAVRIGHPGVSSLVVRKLGDNDLLMVASKEYLDRRGRPTAMEELTGHDTIVYAHDDVVVDHWKYRTGGEVNTIKVKPRFLVNDGYAMLRAAGDGMGIALIAKYMIGNDLEKGRLEAILPEIELEPYAPVYLAYPARDHLPAKTRTFIEYLVNRCKGG
ncbi:MAG: LysR family transcriptional regulator [Acidobacteriota bacterium]|nr:LysR family transcriptional regulator [Acidobacteriota bacterium]